MGQGRIEFNLIEIVQKSNGPERRRLAPNPPPEQQQRGEMVNQSVSSQCLFAVSVYDCSQCSLAVSLWVSASAHSTLLERGRQLGPERIERGPTASRTGSRSAGMTEGVTASSSAPWIAPRGGVVGVLHTPLHVALTLLSVTCRGWRGYEDKKG